LGDASAPGPRRAWPALLVALLWLSVRRPRQRGRRCGCRRG
jgi:hypothetical protein